PHPNEPVGAMTIDFLAHHLVANSGLAERLHTTWFMVPCADPDSTRLNEGWFDGPFTVTNYARHFYRPPGTQQVEWTFPLHYRKAHFERPMPETRALMRLIDEVRPHFVYSLHNAGFGGVYFYISRAVEGGAQSGQGAGPGYGAGTGGGSGRSRTLYEELHGIVREVGVPLALGEPEMPWVRRFEQAIYKLPEAREAYDYFARFVDEQRVPEMMHGGGSSAEYAGRYGALSFVCEVPYFYDARIQDETPTGRSRRESVRRAIEASREWLAIVGPGLEALRVHVEISGRPAGDSVGAMLATLEERVAKLPGQLEARQKWAESDPELERPATVAEAFDSELVMRFYELLNLGVFLRLCDEVLLEGRAPREVIERVRDQAEQAFSRWAQELEQQFNYRAIEIPRLVALQAASGLAVLRHVTAQGPRPGPT
ncbi:MAG: hypothetical protein AB1609_05680, partial [Bacillota bacterium]